MFDLQCSVPSTTLHNGNMDLVSFKTVVKERISYVMLLLRTKYHLKLYSLLRQVTTFKALFSKEGLSKKTNNISVNENNKLRFQTKKNFKTDSTELYDISYQYLNDCLTAGLVFRREFYEDNDVQPKDTLMFKITFVPFTGAKAPLINK